MVRHNGFLVGYLKLKNNFVVIPLVFMQDRVDGQRNSDGRQIRLDGKLDVLVVEG
jgi:hypothetical protein